MEKVMYLSVKPDVPAKGYWDQYLLSRLLIGCEEVTSLDGLDECIVIIPGAYQADVVEEINKELNKLKRCIVVITSDEENKFPIRSIKHPNIKLYTQYPHSSGSGIAALPIGFSKDIDDLKVDPPIKNVDMFFAGQINHESRARMLVQITGIENSKVLPTNGFAKGMEHKDYYVEMAWAKVAPAPRGNISPDSFRAWEALELGAVPIVEDIAFWEAFFPTYPFPCITDSEQWPGYIKDVVNSYPYLNNKCQAWWAREKNRIKTELRGLTSDITVVVPVSPIPSHPDCSILIETLLSIKHHLPEAQIIVTFDGIREEQAKVKSAYYKHIQNFLWITRGWSNVIPYLYDSHQHQIGMLRDVLPTIKTPLILYVEQDTPLVTDAPVDWERLSAEILAGNSNLIRFHFENHVPKEHKYLMLGTPENDLLKTIQWSQRPHLASTAFYNNVVKNYFSPEAKCFIEDRMHGRVIEDYTQYGEQGWNLWRMHIYHPEGSIKRSYNLDGRAGDKKYDSNQIW